MNNPLLDLLSHELPPSFKEDTEFISDPATAAYLTRLASLSYDAITHDEPAAIKASQHTLDVSLQSLASRSHKQFINASTQLSKLPQSYAKLQASVVVLKEKLPELDASISSFSTTFQKQSQVLQERQQQFVLARNLPKLLDILELPTMLQSAISSSNSSLALDVHAHVRRLAKLYPTTEIILSISKECDLLLQQLKSQLLSTLRQSLKLPLAIKTIGYLKRTMPDISGGEEVWGSIFLVARLAFLESLFQALDPLRDLAEQERIEWERNLKTGFEKPGGRDRVVGGQTERYLKRWIEVFREQSFAIMTMYRAIFPASSAPTSTTSLYMPPQTPLTPSIPKLEAAVADPNALPSPLNTFVTHLLSLLTTTLQTYLPIISDKSSRESLLTQVLYASGSLGRLGGDFGLILSLGVLRGQTRQQTDTYEEDDEEDGEWIEMMNKHKVLAGRLEDIAAGRSSVSLQGGKSPLLT